MLSTRISEVALWATPLIMFATTVLYVTRGDAVMAAIVGACGGFSLGVALCAATRRRVRVVWMPPPGGKARGGGSGSLEGDARDDPSGQPR